MRRPYTPATTPSGCLTDRGHAQGRKWGADHTCLSPSLHGGGDACHLAPPRRERTDAAIRRGVGQWPKTTGVRPPARGTRAGMTRHPTRMPAVTARIDASLHDRARSRALIVGVRRRQQHKMQPVVRRAHLHHRRCVPGERPACCSSTASLGSSASNVACRSAVSAWRDGQSQRSMIS